MADDMPTAMPPGGSPEKPAQAAAMSGAPAQRVATLSGATSDTLRMQQENLLSVVVLCSNDLQEDRAEIERISAWVAPRFSYYEILVIGAAPPAGWRSGMRDLGTRLANLRVVVLQNPLGYEDAQMAALDHAIGDYLLLVYPGDISTDDLGRVIGRLAKGQSDVVKTFHQSRGQSRLERAMAAATWGLVRLITGHRIEAFQARALGLSRSAVTRLQMMGGSLRFFRILDMSDLIATDRIEIGTAPRRRFWSAFSAKLRLAADLISLSAGRLIRSLALVCLVLALISFAVAGLALLIWFFLPEVAPGWTSLSMLFSVLFGANFSVLGAICLGLLQLIRRAEPDLQMLVASEMSGGDFFEGTGPLNVQAEDNL